MTLRDHLATGLTHVCQCWAITRQDGVTLGFTDHDRDLAFDSITFKADSGMSAKALASSSGMSVNNTEAVGILTAATITEADIAAGRYDDADVTVWQVRWDDVTAREIRFRGKIGEITRKGASFQADLRGLSDALNQPQGRSYLRTCSAVLGDAACKVDMNDAEYTVEIAVDQGFAGQVIDLPVVTTFNDHWFEGGILHVTSGPSKGLSAAIKHDRAKGGRRTVTLWQDFPAQITGGDTIKLIAGCDKRAETCVVKYRNLVNFQGFPHIPGDDWVTSVPRSDADNTGGRLR